jgi:hypothetical protein
VYRARGGRNFKLRVVTTETTDQRERSINAMENLEALRKQLINLIRVDMPEEEIKRQKDLHALFGTGEFKPVSYVEQFNYIMDKLTTPILRVCPECQNWRWAGLSCQETGCTFYMLPISEILDRLKRGGQVDPRQRLCQPDDKPEGL